MVCASITRMIRHYVPEGHPHNANERKIASGMRASPQTVMQLLVSMIAHSLLVDRLALA